MPGSWQKLAISTKAGVWERKGGAERRASVDGGGPFPTSLGTNLTSY